jgi:hypothetical protein
MGYPLYEGNPQALHEQGHGLSHTQSIQMARRRNVKPGACQSWICFMPMNTPRKNLPSLAICINT